MPTIQSAIEIDAPAHQLFALAQDYRLRLQWDPFLRGMRFLDGASAPAVGVRVWVRTRIGLTMVVRYITYRAPAHVAMTMATGPWIFRRFSGAWNFYPLTHNRTRVVFRYHFTTRPRILHLPIDAAVRWVLQREMDARLAGFKRSSETTDILQRLSDS